MNKHTKSLHLTEDTHKELKQYAKENGLQLNFLADKVIKQFLEEKEKS